MVSGGGGAPGEILYRAIPVGIWTGRRPHGLAVIPAGVGPQVRERRRSPASPYHWLGGMSALSDTRYQAPVPLPRAEHSSRKTSRVASTSDSVL